MARAWDAVTELLCVRLDAIGDLLMTTPALRALRQAHPHRRITLLTSPPGARIADLIPEVDRVITYAPPWMKATPLRRSAAEDFAMAARLAEGGFDGAVIFTVYSQSPLPAAMLCHLAEIPRRLAHCHENPYQLLSDWVPDPEPVRTVRHEVRRQLDLVATIGCRTSDERLGLRVPTDRIARMTDRLERVGVRADRPWLILHPGATAPSRRYPPESFAVAAETLVREHGCQAVFTGSAGERALVETIRRAMDVPSHSLAGDLDLHDLVALIALAPLLIVNNTGPAHIAAAVGTPVVDLYALTNLQHMPWQVESRVLFHEVPCRACYKSVCPEGHHHCLRRVAPAQVVEAALELLDAGSGRTASPTCWPAAV